MARLDGVSDLNGKLDELVKGAKGAAKAGNDRLADRAAAEMRANIPVETGRLAGTIRVTRDNWNSTAVEVGDDGTQYLGFVEFGSSNMAAQPFVRPAAGRAESDLESTMTAEARGRIR